MKKKFIMVPLCFVFLTLLFGCNSNSDSNSNDAKANQDVIKLKVATHTNEDHYSFKYGIKPWMDKVSELTDDKIEFEVYTNEQLGDADNSYNLLKNKTADITFVLYAEDQIPLLDLPMLPNAYQSASQGTRAYWKVISEDGPMLNDVLLPKNIKPIFSMAQSPYTFLTNKEKIKALQDIKGKTLRTSGGLSDTTLESLGGTPISMTINDTREALDKGSVDGLLIGWLSILPYQIEDSIEYMVDNGKLNGWGAFYAINNDTFDSLPEDIKDAMNKASEEVVDIMADGVDKEEKEVREVLEEKGIDLYSIEESEWDVITGELDSEVDKWIKRLEDKGEPAEEAYEQFQKAVQEFE